MDRIAHAELPPDSVNTTFDFSAAKARRAASLLEAGRLTDDLDFSRNPSTDRLVELA